MEAFKKNIHTYKEYLLINDGNRYEIIDGNLFLLASPSEIHQRVLGNLYLILGNYFKYKTCSVYFAPFDVLLGDENIDEVKNVVQPDIFIVCDKSKLSSGKYLKGAPDFVCEILSPSTSTVDFVYKKYLYEKYGVKEYWIVSPEEKKITIFKNTNGKFDQGIVYDDNGLSKPVLLNLLQIDINEVFR
ncbi:Uma2 family endonuclease [Caldicellulosiruptoraceae bacterium PP1]